MKMKTNLIIILSLMYLSFPAFILAETVILKSGKKIEGKIVEKTDKYIKIDFYGIPLTYFLDEVESIEGEPTKTITYEEMATQAEKESEEFLKNNPNSVMAYNKRGIAYRMNGNLEESIVCFTKAIEIDPSDAESYHHRGLSYGSSKIKKYDLALADFNKAIEINPKEGEYYFERATVYYITRENDKVCDDIYKADALGFKVPVQLYAELRAMYSACFNNRGLNYAKEGNYDLAISEYNKALENVSDNAVSLYSKIYANRADAYSNKSSFNQAISDYTKAIEIDPKDPSLYHDRGSAYVDKGDFDQAIADYNKVLEIDPSWANRYNGQFYNDRAIPYFFKKEYDKAWEDLNKAMSMGYKVHPDFLRELKNASGRKR